jgi:hypothetical protein
VTGSANNRCAWKHEEAMILKTRSIDPEELERPTGWLIKPEGACKRERCVSLPTTVGSPVDAHVLGDRIGMPLVHDELSGPWCLGPETGGHALTSVETPALVLPDIHGREFHLRSVRGRKERGVGCRHNAIPFLQRRTLLVIVKRACRGPAWGAATQGRPVRVGARARHGGG